MSKLIKFLSVLIINLSVVSIYAAESPPAKSLLVLFNSNPEFVNQWNQTIENLHPMPDGSPNIWEGKTEEDLINFIDDWYYFLPSLHDGLDKIYAFSMLYYKNKAGQEWILSETTIQWTLEFVQSRGDYMDSPDSLIGVKLLMNHPEIILDDYIIPDEGFTSFNDFFTKSLKAGKRPITKPSDDGVLVSPADGILQWINNDLTLDGHIPTKGEMALSLNALLENSDYAKQFVGGSALATFLMPDDYHHYHAPVSGSLVESREHVGKRLFGMNDFPAMLNKGNPGYNKPFSVIENFIHGYFIFKTENYGYVAMIPVGLHTVGSVTFENPLKEVNSDNPIYISKGERLGNFAYGGSTVLLLFEQGRLSSLSVRQGQQIGRLIK